MNKIFRVIWSEAKEKWLVVAETVKSCGGAPSWVVGSVALMAAVLCGALPGYAIDPTALPSGGRITAGSGSIATSGSQMTVNQATQQMIANWNTFNIGKNAGVQFVQPNAAATALNRIADQNPSQILGSLSANGRLFLINPSGIVFGQGAQVNVGGLVASTLNMLDADFLAGKYRFQNSGSSGSVLNQGTINAAPGGVVALIAPRVVNEGTITAPGGSVALAAGNQVTVDFTGDGLINLAIDEGAVDAQVANSGLIKVDGGVAVMSARSANALAAAAVNNTGIIEAKNLTSVGGKIIMEGDEITLASGSKLEASGALGGGTVLVGGDWQGSGSMRQATRVTMEQGASIDASATQSGDGGKVVLWSDVHTPNSVTTMNGEITTLGAGSGKGGAIETSGRALQIDGTANAGSGGQWLLDPTDIIIGSSGTDPFNDPSSTNVTSYVNAATLSTALNNGNYITVSTQSQGTGSGNITVNSSIQKTVNGVSAGLTLYADGRVSIANGLTIGVPTGSAYNSVGSVDISLYNSGNAPTSPGVVSTIMMMGTLRSNGGSIRLGGYTGGYYATMNAAGPNNNQPAVYINGTIDSTYNSTPNVGGSIFIGGRGNSIAGGGGLQIANSTIKAGSGNITLTGEGYFTGGGSARGIELDVTNTISGGYVTLQSYMSGNVANASIPMGIYVLNGTTTVSASGSVTVNIATDNSSSTFKDYRGLVFSSGALTLNSATAGASVPISITTDRSIESYSDIYGVKISTGGTVSLDASAYPNYGKQTDITLAGTYTGGSFSAAASGTINLSGAKITANSGGITLAAKTMGSNGVTGYGITATGATLTSAGGNITLAGAYGGYAYGSGGNLGNDGIRLINSTVKVNGGSGGITVAGQGFSTYGNTPGYGVYVQSSTLETTGSGGIDIRGEGYAYNYNGSGIYLTNSAMIRTASGAISLYGRLPNNAGITTGTNNGSIFATGGVSTIQSTSGAITLSGQVDLASVPGLRVASGSSLYIGSNSSNSAAGGNLALYTDLAPVASGTLRFQSYGSMTIAPYTSGISMGVGSGAGGNLLLLQTMPSWVSGWINSLYLGSSTTGTLTVGGANTLTEALTLTSGSSYSTVFNSNASLSMGTNSISIYTGSLSFGGNNTISGTGNLSVGGTDSSVNLTLAGAGGLALNTNWFSAASTAAGRVFSDGFSSITLGRTNGGNLSVAGAFAATDPLTIITSKNLTINNSGTVTSSQGDLALAAVGATGKFINNAGSAPNILTPGAGGRWLVYSYSPELNDFGNTGGGTNSAALASGNEGLFNKPYASNLPASLSGVSGNRYLFEAPARMATTLGSTSKTYGQVIDLSFLYSGSYTLTGAQSFGGAVIAGADPLGGIAPNVTVTSTGNTTTANVGSYTVSVTVDAASQTALTNAGYVLAPVTGTLTVNKANLSATGSMVYNNTTTFAGSALTVNGVNGERFTASGSGTLSTKNVQTNQVLASMGSLTLTGVSGALTSNYNLLAVGQTSVSVTTRPLTVTATGLTKTYDGTSYSGGNGVSISGYASGESVAVLGGPLTYSGTSQGARNAGTYLITPGGYTNTNYAYNYVSGTLTINKKSISLVAPSVTKVYDGLLSYTTTAANLTTMASGKLVGGDTLASATIAYTQKDAGTSNKTVTLSNVVINDDNGGNNYTVTSLSGNSTSTISKKDITLTMNGTPTKVYDGTTSASLTGITYTLAGLVGTESIVFNPTGLTGTYNTKDAGSKTVTTSSTSGKFTYSSGAIAGNYTVPTVVTGSGTISQRPITITANNGSKTYGLLWNYVGTGKTAGTNPGQYQITSGTMAGTETIGSVTLASAGAAVTAHRADGEQGLGLFNITPSAATGGTFNASNYAITYAPGTLTVNPAAITLRAADSSKTYGDVKTWAGSWSDLVKTSGTLYNGDTFGATLTSAGAAATAHRADGDTGVTGQFYIDVTNVTGIGTTKSSDYTITLASGASRGVLTVNTRPLDVTVNNWANCSDCSLDTSKIGYVATNLANGDSITSMGITVSGSDSFGGRINSRATGTYDLIAGSATFADAKSNQDYSITSHNGALEVNTNALVLRADNLSKVYGQALDLTAAGGYSVLDATAAGSGNETGGYGFAVGDNFQNGWSPVRSSGGAASTANVGSYLINLSVAGAKIFDDTGNPLGNDHTGNYAIGLATGNAAAGTLTVTPRPITITPTAQTKAYGDAKNLGTTGFTVDDSSTGGSANIAPGAIIVNTDAISNVALASSGTGAAEHAGSYDITSNNAVFLSGSPSNYNITYATGTSGNGKALTVNPLAITITANDAGKIYGDDLTGTMGNGKTAFMVKVTDDASSLNNAVYLPNSDTIGSVTLTSGGAATTAHRAVGNDGGADGLWNITPSAATGGSFTAGDYAITYANGKLTINQKELTYSAGSYTGTYGATSAANVSATLSGTINGDNVTPVNQVQTLVGGAVTPSGAGYVPAGEYNVVVGSLGGTHAADYALAISGNSTGYLKVDPKVITVDLVGAVSKTYDGSTAATLTGATLTPNGLMNGDVVNLSGTPTIGTFDNRNAGTSKAITAELSAVTVGGWMAATTCWTAARPASVAPSGRSARRR